jgi:subtilase family serine protease
MSTSTVRPAIAHAGGHYARLVPLCAPPAPGRVSCFAIRSAPVSVTPGTALPAGVHAQAAFGNGPAGAYSPSDLQALYAFSRASGGRGQTIGIVDWFDDPKALADLDHFDHTYGFPAETAKTFKKINETGKAKPLPAASATSGQADTSPETTLDIQSARAVCGHCRILLVEAKASKTRGPTDTDLAKAENTAVRHGADEVSNSFGASEHRGAAAKRFAKAFNHPGVVITAATGDAGWYSWDVANGGSHAPSAPNAPATFRSVVAVGGTTLPDTGKQAKPVRQSETVWNENGPADSVGAQGPPNGGPHGASGGGCSKLFAAQRWQRHVAGYKATGCGTKRLAADVSAIADPQTGFDVYDSYDTASSASHWFTVGGTSLSSPVVAAMWALVGGAHKVKYPALTLYGNEKTHAASLHDVTAGGNAFCDGVDPVSCESHYTQPPNTFGFGRLECSFAANSGTRVVANHQCVAAPGYDGPSGVGTPAGLKVFRRLSPRASIHVVALRRNHPGTFSAKVVDPFPGGRIAKYSWAFGDGHHSRKAHPKHAFAKAKTFTVTLTVTDVFGLRHTTHSKVHVKR